VWTIDRFDRLRRQRAGSRSDITHTDLVMQDGTKMQAMVVKMHGKMYVMMAVDDLPDYLHQQITKVMQ
jgi:hypothetical protein